MKLGELFQSYTRSPAFGDLKQTSQINYERAYTSIEWLLGNADVTSVKRADIIQMRDALSDTPGISNRNMSILSIMFAHAMDMDLVPYNPVVGVKRLKMGEHRAWTEAETSKASLFLHGKARRVFYLCLYTGQRIGDVTRMQWGQVHTMSNGAPLEQWSIEVDQNKTGAKVHVTLPDALKKEMDTWLNEIPIGNWRARYICSGTTKMTPHAIREATRIAIKSLDIHATIHGLRKTAASRMAEAGCSDQEIASVTGHKTMAMISKYTKFANQKKLAANAAAKMNMQADQ